jgi:hypothetical protein
VAVDSFPNTPHNNRLISLAENEQLWAGVPSGLIGYTGVTPVYADSTGRQVKVRAGVAGRIRGTRFNNTTETIVPVTTNTSGNPRVDLLVARLNRPGGYVVGYAVIPGAPGASPIAPQPVRNDTIDGSGTYDIPLAEIKVAHNYTSVAAADVSNRAWWVSPSGFYGFDAAKPPAEGAALFRATDTGITYIGTPAGSWQRLYYNTGWKALTAPTGYTFGAMHFARSGDLVVMNARVIRTNATIASGTNLTFGTLAQTYRPGMTVWGVYHCTNPDHSSHVAVGADGLITFAGASSTIAQNANLLSNMTWLAAE